MTRFFYSRKESKGKAPGSLIFIGNHQMDNPVVRLITYDKETYNESTTEQLETFDPHADTKKTIWLNIDGLEDTKLIENLGSKLDLHPLILEDIVDTTQRPKIETTENHIFIIAKMFRHDAHNNKIIAEQFSMVIGLNYLITFQETKGDVFEPVRHRLRTASTKIRERGAAYLGYALLDAILENTLSQIEIVGQQVEELDNSIINNFGNPVLEKIQIYKQEVNYMRRWVRPIKEAILQLNRTESKLIPKQTRPYLGDLLELATYALESIENYQNMLSEQIQIYSSLSGNKLNETMRILTVISVIFMPLSFLAGVYGTNFAHMPELSKIWAYPAFWVVEIGLAIAMFVMFKKRKWL